MKNKLRTIILISISFVLLLSITCFAFFPVNIIKRLHIDIETIKNIEIQIASGQVVTITNKNDMDKVVTTLNSTKYRFAGLHVAEGFNCRITFHFEDNTTKSISIIEHRIVNRNKWLPTAYTAIDKDISYQSIFDIVQ